MIFKGCIYNLIRIRNTDSKSPIFESVHIVNEFAWVFQDDWIHVPPKKEVDFGIELVLITQPISTAPYCMVVAESKDIMLKLKYLYYKGFIWLSISPCGAKHFFFTIKMVHAYVY